jgi:hypothetical protein
LTSDSQAVLDFAIMIIAVIVGRRLGLGEV